MKFLIKNVVHQSGANEIIKAIQNELQKMLISECTDTININTTPDSSTDLEKETDDIKIIKARIYKI